MAKVIIFFHGRNFSGDIPGKYLASRHAFRSFSKTLYLYPANLCCMKKISVADINFYLYSLLLIVTPFLMLLNFLQSFIGKVSRLGIVVAGVEVAYTVFIATGVLAVLLIRFGRKMTRVRWLALGAIVLLFAIGQLTADYYFGHHFSDLQHNWHYFAYGIFSFLAFRKFGRRGMPVNRIIARTFMLAFAISLFDEIIQIFISNRVFDISDVAKDLWGAMIGQVLVLFVLREGRDIRDYRFRQPAFIRYFREPFALLCTELIGAYCLLFVGSMLTNAALTARVFLIVLPCFLLILLIIHAGNNKVLRWSFRGLILALFLVVGGRLLFAAPRAELLGSSLILYKGIPLPYFDYMIFPDGGLRPVDKKEKFAIRDKLKIESLGPDILLLATGARGEGGKGWNDHEFTEFYFNNEQQKSYQILKLKTPEALATYNRLMKEHKKVLMIIHNP